jgi:hypothetical protein
LGRDNNILRGNVPLTKLQKEKLKRNKAGLRALTKKSFSLKQKRDHAIPSESHARVTRNGM